MPRYRLLRRPSYLDFRNGRVRFDYHRVDGYTWHWTAIRNVGLVTLVLYAAPHQTDFDRDLANGFDIEPGGPAERILAVLVAKGYAEKLS